MMPVDILSFILAILFLAGFLIILGESLSKMVFLWKPSLLFLIPFILVLWILLSKNYEIETSELNTYTTEGVDYFIDNNKIINANDMFNRGFSEGDTIIKIEYKEHYNNLLLYPEYIKYKVK